MKKIVNRLVVLVAAILAIFAILQANPETAAAADRKSVV